MDFFWVEKQKNRKTDHMRAGKNSKPLLIWLDSRQNKKLKGMENNKNSKPP